MTWAIASACRLSDAIVRNSRDLFGKLSTASAEALGEQAATLSAARAGASATSMFDDAGPTITSTCASNNCCRLTAADAESVPSSRITISTGWPFTPPAELACSTATRIAARADWPMEAPSPLAGRSTPTRITPSSTLTVSVVEGLSACVAGGATTGSDELHAASRASAVHTAISDRTDAPTDDLAPHRLLIGCECTRPRFDRVEPLHGMMMA